MKIKVCGMRDSNNILELIKLKPDFVGFIFYNKSRRFVAEFTQIKFPEKIKKVGVFVNENINKVLEKAKKHQLDFVQLHGDETPEYCHQLKLSYSKRGQNEIQIIKAFSVDEVFDFSQTNLYKTNCNYFLFDTKGENYGGNGIKFNWEILQNYEGETPYFLSGGIGLEDKDELMSFLQRKEAENCYAIDVNSKFEYSPGIKNIEKLKEFKNNLV